LGSCDTLHCSDVNYDSDNTGNTLAYNSQDCGLKIHSEKFYPFFSIEINSSNKMQFFTWVTNRKILTFSPSKNSPTSARENISQPRHVN